MEDTPPACRTSHVALLIPVTYEGLYQGASIDNFGYSYNQIIRHSFLQEMNQIRLKLLNMIKLYIFILQKAYLGTEETERRYLSECYSTNKNYKD